eukprot:gnl/MRDRNA2_/MRDRNA2_27783_c0_seq1.p1 gnl/MRDRNA2_/MRDRNA2_27783_c0~~gnl/MRDRNA2_/MRDRNA2_27783_c0_seq1.p1  ORF type:complete len:423 (-),score=105.31 gnl/MRDRNA2_/MRDRNA2_27783_c0_seq1:114-1382(-)
MEAAWWEAVFRTHLVKPDQLRAAFDWPGDYLVVRDTFLSSESDRLQGEKVGDVKVPATVEVLEVQVSGDRVRGRLKQPAGWISLRSTDNEKVFAVPGTSMHARMFREFNPGLFCSDCKDPCCEFPAAPAHILDGSRMPSVADLRSCGSGADVNAPDENGFTALIAAVSWQWMQGLDALCEMKADVDKGDARGKRPLHYALQGSEDIIRRLLDAEADPAQQDKNEDVQNLRGLEVRELHRTPLHYAVHDGLLGAVTLLLEGSRGAKIVNIRDADYKTAFHLALEHDHRAIVDALLQANADVNLGNLDLGLTTSPLMDAVYRNDLPMASMLVAANAKLDLMNKSNMTALHIAARGSHVEMVKLLVEAKCDTTLEVNGKTAADLADKNGSEEIAVLLGSTTKKAQGEKVVDPIMDPALRAALFLE